MFGQTVTASGDTMAPAPQPRHLASPKKWRVHGHRVRRRLRRGAVPLPRPELRQRAAMGDRPGTVPAGGRPLARLPDHRPSQRRALHQLSAPDPAADGPELPQRAAARRSIPMPPPLSHPAAARARILAVRDRHHDPRRRRRASWAWRDRGPSGRRAPRPTSPSIATSRTAKRCSPRRTTSSRTASWWCATAQSSTSVVGQHPCRAARSSTAASSASSRAYFERYQTPQRGNFAIGDDEMCEAAAGGRLVTSTPADGATRMIINGVAIDDTFAEAFGMKATRAHRHRPQRELGARSRRRGHDRLRHLGHRLRRRGRRSSANCRRTRRPTAGPASRVLLFAVSTKELAKQVERRVGQCVLTCPTTRRASPASTSGEAAAAGQDAALLRRRLPDRPS